MSIIDQLFPLKNKENGLERNTCQNNLSKNSVQARNYFTTCLIVLKLNPFGCMWMSYWEMIEPVKDDAEFIQSC